MYQRQDLRNKDKQGRTTKDDTHTQKVSAQRSSTNTACTTSGRWWYQHLPTTHYRYNRQVKEQWQNNCANRTHHTRSRTHLEAMITGRTTTKARRIPGKSSQQDEKGIILTVQDMSRSNRQVGKLQENNCDKTGREQ